MSEFDKNKGFGKEFGKEKDLGKTGQTPGGARQTGTPGQPMGGTNQKTHQTGIGGTSTGNLNKQQQWDKDKNKQR